MTSCLLDEVRACVTLRKRINMLIQQRLTLIFHLTLLISLACNLKANRVEEFLKLQQSFNNPYHVLNEPLAEGTRFYTWKSKRVEEYYRDFKTGRVSKKEAKEKFQEWITRCQGTREYNHTTSTPRSQEYCRRLLLFSLKETELLEITDELLDLAEVDLSKPAPKNNLKATAQQQKFLDIQEKIINDRQAK